MGRGTTGSLERATVSIYIYFRVLSFKLLSQPVGD
jgi:hypothetical protein